jgi:hypothetical protein
MMQWTLKLDYWTMSDERWLMRDAARQVIDDVNVVPQ